MGIAVSAASPIQNINELVEMMKADPGSVSWAGGSAGGVDHITVGLLAKAAGVDPTKINYVAFSGGGEALAAILGNQVTVGISGVGEFLPQVEAGTMRMLAVSTAEKWPGTDAPTLMEVGLRRRRAELAHGRGGPGPVATNRRPPSCADIDKLANSAGWKAMLDSKGWANTYLAGAEFRRAARQGDRGHDRRPEGHRSGAMSGSTPQPDVAPMGRRSSSRRLLAALGALLIWQGRRIPDKGGYAGVGSGDVPGLIGCGLLAAGADGHVWQGFATGDLARAAPDSRCRSCGSSAGLVAATGPSASAGLCHRLGPALRLHGGGLRQAQPRR